MKHADYAAIAAMMYECEYPYGQIRGMARLLDRLATRHEDYDQLNWDSFCDAAFTGHQLKPAEPRKLEYEEGLDNPHFADENTPADHFFKS